MDCVEKSVEILGAPPMEYRSAPTAMEAAVDLDRLDLLNLDSVFRHRSVLDTPPILDATTTPGFPNCNDALSSMESGLFNDIPTFDSIMESANVVSSVLDIGTPVNMAGLNPEPVQSPIAAPVAAAQSVQFDYHPDILLEAKNESVVINDQPMPIVRATSHDHAYVNSQNEDYQILRDFLIMGHDLGVGADSDDEELNAIIGDFDFGQLAPRNSYMDTYGDLTPMLNDGPEDMDEESQVAEVPEGQEVTQDHPSIQYEEPSASATVCQYDDQSTSSQFDYAPSTYSISPCSTPSVIPKSSSKARNSRKGVSSGFVKDAKYWERRQKNNVASARSRQTRKERMRETELERERLEVRNRQLKEELAHLERMVDEHKRKFFSAFKK